jgi:1-deoxy-D-xylulose-5-phosphate synthase
MAVARDQRGGGEHVVAVVGDAALGCGISFEALNNISTTTRRLIVILNDNEMSIAENVGAISKYLGRLLASRKYNRVKTGIENVARKALRSDWYREVYHRAEEAVKGMFLRSPMFEELGLRYIGPMDGHDLAMLVSALKIARDDDKPILLHVATTKGKGYKPAEDAPEVWHSTTGSRSIRRTARRFCRRRHRPLAGRRGSIRTFSVAPRSNWREGRTHRGDHGGHAFRHGALPVRRGVSLPLLRRGHLGGARRHLRRRSGVRERAPACGHLLHVPAARGRLRDPRRVPAELPVVFCLDRAGVVGDDGPTHHGVFDIALFRAVPGLTMMQPCDEAELCRHAAPGLQWTPGHDPLSARQGPGVAVPTEPLDIPFGRAQVLEDGADVQIWALGDMLPLGRAVARRLRAGLFRRRREPALHPAHGPRAAAEQARAARVFVTIENGVREGGFGSGLQEALSDAGEATRVLRCGWPRAFVTHAGPADLLRLHGLTEEAIAEAALALLARQLDPVGGLQG